VLVQQVAVAPPPKRVSRGLIAAIIIVLCILLGVGLYIVVDRWAGNGTTPPPAPPPASSTPTETSPPPPDVNRWADGYQTLWSIQPATSDNRWVWVSDQTATRILLRVSEDEADATWMLDRATGQTLWSQDFECYWPQLVGDEVWCRVDNRGHNTTHRFDAATGENIDIITVDELGLLPDDKNYYAFDGIWSMFGSPFAEYSDQKGWTGPDFNLARLSADATEVIWKTHFTYIPSESFYRSSQRLHHGVLTDNRKYAISLEDGTALPVCNKKQGCFNIEWVAENVLMGQIAAPQSVTFPDNTTGVLTGPGAISVTSNKLPPNPLRWSNGAIEAYDALTGSALWTTPAPRLTGEIESIAGQLDGLYAAYDGTRVVVADMDGHVMAFNPADGTLLWDVALPLKAPCTTPDFMDDGLLLIQQMDYPDVEDEVVEEGLLYALDPESGAIWWSVKGVLAGKRANQYPFLGDTAQFGGIIVQTNDDTISHLAPR